MGWNTTVVVLNDALEQIKGDSAFGSKLARAIGEVSRGKSVDVSAGNHGNAATVIETHHADENVLVRVGGNYGVVVDGRVHAALVEALKACAGVLSGEGMSKSSLVDALEKTRAALALAGETP